MSLHRQITHIGQLLTARITSDTIQEQLTQYFEEGHKYEVTLPLGSIVLPTCKAVDLYDPSVVCEKKINKLDVDHDGIEDDIVIAGDLALHDIAEERKYRVRYFAITLMEIHHPKFI